MEGRYGNRKWYLLGKLILLSGVYRWPDGSIYNGYLKEGRLWGKGMIIAILY